MTTATEIPNAEHLASIREEWENEHDAVILEHYDEENRRFLVVRKAARRGEALYECNRYFLIGNEWCCSCDAHRVDDVTAMRWLVNPRAIGSDDA